MWWKILFGALAVVVALLIWIANDINKNGVEQ